MRRFFCLAALMLVVGCTNQPPQPYATLPADSVQGAGDPLRSAVNQSAFVFSNPRQFVNRPIDVARAVANLEYMTVAVPVNPAFTNFGGGLPNLLIEGRSAARVVYGIAGDAEPQAVIDGLYAVARALVAGERAASMRALSAPAFPNPAATMQALSQAPIVPAANVATSRVAEEIMQTRTERRL